MSDNNSAPLEPYARFTGLAEWRSALLAILQRAADEGWPQLLLCDPDFSLWPLGDSEVLAALERWSSRPRQFTLIAGDYRYIEQHFPRFIQWRQQWDHIVQAHAAAPIHSASLPRYLLAPPHRAVQILDETRCRGITLEESNAVRELQEVSHEILLKARPAFAASTIGL